MAKKNPNEMSFLDHLEELNSDDLSALSGTDTIATILPSCSHFLNIPFGEKISIFENICFVIIMQQ